VLLIPLDENQTAMEIKFLARENAI
jgi:hypothetical protein